MDLVLYTWNSCSFCSRAKQRLEERGIAFREENLDGKRELLRRLQRESGFHTVPLVLLDGEFLGGLAELESWLESGP